MTLLEWDKQGRKGRFKTAFWYVEAGLNGSVIFYTIHPHTGKKSGMIPFSSLRHLCGYLGRGPSEMVGEVE